MHPVISIQRRFRFWWQALRHAWSLPVIVFAGFLWSVFSLVRDELLSKELQTKYKLRYILPDWSIETWLLIMSLIFIVALIEAGYQKGKNLQKELGKTKNELDLLNTPSVSLELWGIEEDIEGIQTAFLEVTGQSAKPVRVEVFGTSVHPPTSIDGKYILHLASGTASPFSVHRGETHRSIPVLRYNPREVGPSIHVEVPFQIPTSDIIRGNEFSLEVKAFGGTQAATLNFHFGVNKDTGELWAQKVGHSERLTSNRLEASPRQMQEQFEQGFYES